MLLTINYTIVMGLLWQSEDTGTGPAASYFRLVRPLSALKVARYPKFSKSTNLESKLIKLFVFVNFEQTVRFGSLEPFTVCKIGDFPHFLSALASNNQFIIKLVKMWPGGIPFMWWSEL